MELRLLRLREHLRLNGEFRCREEIVDGWSQRELPDRFDRVEIVVGETEQLCAALFVVAQVEDNVGGLSDDDVGQPSAVRVDIERPEGFKAADVLCSDRLGPS